MIWIAGGVDKGNDYRDLLPLVDKKVKHLICLGKDNKKLIESFSNLNQTKFEWEVLVIDNASNDDTKQIVNKLKNKLKFKINYCCSMVIDRVF